MNGPTMELLRGTLDVMVLRALAAGPEHGYGIAAWLRERSGGALQIQDAALYQALRRMELRRWVEAEWGTSDNKRRARYYRLTAAGGRQLEADRQAFHDYAAVVTRVLDPSPGGAR